MEDEPVPPRRLQPSLPCDLETICLKCLAKKPKRRYATALMLANDLRQFLESTQARVGSAKQIRWKWVHRSALATGLLAGVGLLALLGVALFWWT
jgi:hypothetical protein